jgi:hypothetical protein
VGAYPSGVSQGLALHLTLKYQTKLKHLVKDKRALAYFRRINDEEKSFIELRPTFTFVLEFFFPFSNFKFSD